MYVATSILFFLLGLIFGSFFNVVGLRLPTRQPFVNDRSRCPHCRETLSWRELIPVLSYLLQRGRCRHCRAGISWIYPVVELLTGCLFAASFAVLGWQFELLIALLLISMLMIIFVSDMVYMLIPNKVLLFFLPLFIIGRLVHPLEPWWSSVAGAVTGAAIIALIILISRGGLGAGDMQLFGVLGFVFGFKEVLLAFFLSCMIGALIGVVLMMLEVVNRKQAVPFGPYIVLGALLTYFFGEPMVDWYMNLLI